MRADKISSIEEILSFHNMSSIDLVSFDIFDTLLIRPSHQPNRVIDLTCEIWAREISLDVGCNITARNVRSLRDNLIQDICNENVRLGHDRDFSYDLMLQRLQYELNLSDKLINILKEIELKNEVEHLKININVVETLLMLKRSGIKIIAISDMYFSSAQLYFILEQFGIASYFTQVISSGDENKLKATGNMFSFLLGSYDSRRWLHVGDNPLADYFAPRKYGIRTLLLFQKPILRARKTSFHSPISNAKSLILSHNSNLNDYIVSYLGFAISCWMYSLCQYCKDNGVNSIFFLAREGVVINRYFEEVKNTFFQELATEARVLNISRSSSETDLFGDYLKSNLKQDEVPHIVDIGWGGTIQKRISKELQRPVIGHYFGTDSRFNGLGSSFIFDSNSDSLPSLKLCFPLIESLLTPVSVGTCLSYSVREGLVVPNIEEPDSYNKNIDQDFVVRKSIQYLDTVLSGYVLTNDEIRTLCLELLIKGFVLPTRSFSLEIDNVEEGFDFGGKLVELVINPIKRPLDFARHMTKGVWIYGCFSSARLGWVNHVLLFAFRKLSFLEALKSLARKVAR